MPLAKEVQEWIEGLRSQGFTDEQIKPMLAVVEGNEAAANYLKKTVMAPAEFSRQMDALKAEQKKAQEEFDKSQKWFESTTKWRDEKSAEYDARLQRAVKAEAALNAAKQRIDMLKTQGYLDDNAVNGIFEGVAVTPSPSVTPAPTATDTPKYVTPEELTKQFNAGSIGVTKFNARLFKLNKQHDQIFAKAGFDPADYQPPEFDADKLIDHVAKNGGTLEQAYEATYGAGSRQQKLTAARTEEEITRRADELYRKRVSEDVQAGRPVSVTPQPSNIRRMAPVPTADTKTFAQKRFERVNRAVAELQSKT